MPFDHLLLQFSDLASGCYLCLHPFSPSQLAAGANIAREHVARAKRAPRVGGAGENRTTGPSQGERGHQSDQKTWRNSGDMYTVYLATGVFGNAYFADLLTSW